MKTEEYLIETAERCNRLADEGRAWLSGCWRSAMS